MKLLGQILVWASLASGALAAATAYLASTEVPVAELAGLTLAAPAGKITQPDGTSQPFAEKDEKVTAELVAALRAAGARNLRVKEFAFRRWRGKWVFLASLLGLVLGALATRRAARTEDAGKGEPGSVDSPERTLKTIQQTIRQLSARLPEMADRSSGLDTIVEEVGRLQKTQMEAFVDARAALTSTLGLAGYAALMDSYATAERQINRAWSASVDRAYDEAVACLEEAAARLEDTRQRLSEDRTISNLDSRKDVQ